MTDPLDRLARNYPPAFLSFLAHPDEEHLHAAYQLGRDALGGGVNLLDLIRTHHTALTTLLPDSTAGDTKRILEAAASFLIEAIAPFEMVRRGFLEAMRASRPGATESGSAKVDRLPLQ